MTKKAENPAPHLNFEETIDEISRLREKLDDHVWLVFGRYIKVTKTLFSDPDEWSVDGNTIHFTGSDGCLGCYDPMSLAIPIGFFADTEVSFLELENSIIKETKEKADREAANREKAERSELARLQGKYGSSVA